MQKNVICSICSRQKAADTRLMPAQQRYLGSHMLIAQRAAKEAGLPFFILSGKFGFISGDTLIPDYDYLLTKDAVQSLSHEIAHQLLEVGVEKIHFYTKAKKNWQPYLEALKCACGEAKVVLRVHELADDA